MVSSATATAFAPGVFITTMPRRVAASASILSTPTPARQSPAAWAPAHQRIVGLNRRPHHSASASARAAGSPSGNWSCVRTSHPGSAQIRPAFRRYLLCQNDLHPSPLPFFAASYSSKRMPCFLAQNLEHRTTAACGLPSPRSYLVSEFGMHPQLLGHLVLEKGQLPPRHQQLFPQNSTRP